MRSAFFLSCAALALAGCATPYQVPPSKPTAQLQLSLQNDSSATTLRTLNTWMYKNEECEKNEHGFRGGNAVFNDAAASLDPMRILAGDKLVFTANYMDARFAQNRKCAITGSFIPLADHRYKALLVVSDNVQTCWLGIYDVTSGRDEQIEFSMPNHVCEGDGKSARLNGQPLWLDWRVNVTTVPVKR